MKFRKRPVVIEAVQFFRNGPKIPGVELVPGERIGLATNDDVFAIKTLEGWHAVIHGDWIITGVKGEKYPCKPDIFEMTYERIEDGAEG